MLKPNLILGADSTLGKTLYNYYFSKNIPCVGTTRDAEKVTDDILYLDYEKCKDFNIDGNFDKVVLCAALTNIKKCQIDPSLSLLINVEAQIKLAEKLSPRCNKLIFISSNAVFDGENPFAKIYQKKNPKTIYGYHKSLVEDYLLDNFDNSYILRITKVLHPQLSLLDNWINSISTNQKIEAFYDMRLSPIHLNYLIDSFVKIFAQPIDRIIHLSGTADITYSDLACELCRMLDKPISYVKEVSYTTLGIDKNMVPNYSSLDCSLTQKHYSISTPTVSSMLIQCLKNSECV